MGLVGGLSLSCLMLNVCLPPSSSCVSCMEGGWDNTVQVWDIRVGYAVRSIYGPHICGDALDMDGNTIVTGSAHAIYTYPHL